MEAEKLVSVIMPVYNVAGFVLQSIKSVINQSYHYFELIIVDDGSSDNSLQIIKKFLSQNPDPRVKLYYKKNGGLSEARNFGLARANGYYIYFIDSDDFIEKNLLEKSISILQQQNSDMVFFNYFEISSGGNNCSRGETIQVSELTNTQRTAIENYLLGKFQNYAWSFVAKKSLYNEHDIQFPVGKKYEDILTLPKLLFQAQRISFIQDFLYFYRQREGSITKVIDETRILDPFYAFEHNILFFHKKLGQELDMAQRCYSLNTMMDVYIDNSIIGFSIPREIRRKIFTIISKNWLPFLGMGTSVKRRILAAFIFLKLGIISDYLIKLKVIFKK